MSSLCGKEKLSYVVSVKIYLEVPQGNFEITKKLCIFKFLQIIQLIAKHFLSIPPPFQLVALNKALPFPKFDIKNF